MLFFIYFINILCISYVVCFSFNFSAKIAPRKLTDTSDMKILPDEEYNHDVYGEPIDDMELPKLPNDGIKVKYMKLPVNHFMPTRPKSWKMKFIQNTQFWKPDAPVYLFVKGNRPTKYNELKEGLMFELAKETGGVMFSVEHRYYGDQNPYKDFRYLTSKQAIADLNALLNNIKNEKDYRNSKIILVGGGYGGSLAVWLKQANPKAANVVVASGAPLLAKENFEEYFKHVINICKNFTPDCAKRIRDQLDIYNMCLNKRSAEKTDCLKSAYPFLEICDNVNMDIPENKQLFFLSQLSVYSEAAERGLRQIYKTCNQFENYIKGLEESIFWDREHLCYNFDIQRFINQIKKRPQYRNANRWLYQSCTEFGFFQTTTTFIFPLSEMIPVEFYLKICSLLFGSHSQFDRSKLNEGIKRTNRRYGGLKPNVTNVIFVFGELDPWRYVGIKHSYNNNEYVIIPGESHCKDLQPQLSTDTLALQKGRKLIKKLVRKMINIKEEKHVSLLNHFKLHGMIVENSCPDYANEEENVRAENSREFEINEPEMYT